MRILFVHPKRPEIFWSFRHALKKAVHPPFGLLTIAAMLPGNWEKGLIDINSVLLRDETRFYYLKLVSWSLFRWPLLLPMAIQYLVYGFHFRKAFDKHLLT